MIESNANNRLKWVKKLQSSSRFRMQEKCFCVEGEREIKRALVNNYQPRAVFYSENCLKVVKRFGELNAELFEVRSSLFESLVYRKKTEKCVFVFDEMLVDIPEVPEKALALVLAGLEKPGNIGAILRTANGLGVDFVFLAGCLSDRYNPNIIRSSLGAVFDSHIISINDYNCMQWLKKHHFETTATALQTELSLSGHVFSQKSAIVLGEEAFGLNENWLNFANHKVKINMKGFVDSFNVSVSASIFAYEAIKQIF